MGLKVTTPLQAVLITLVIVVFGACWDEPKAEVSKVKSARDIHYNTIVIDTHNNSLGNVINQYWLPENDIGNRFVFNQLDLVKMREGGLDVAFFAAFTDDNPIDGLANSRILSLLNALYWLEERNPETFGIAKTPKEMLDLYKSGKLAGVPAIEGGYSLKSHNALELLRQYHDLGAAYMGLCWHVSNALGEGVYERYWDYTPSSGGLTALGLSVVKEMNRLGIAVDISHMNERTFWDVVEAAKAPIIASHSGTWGVYEHARNLKDEQMKAIAESGGVVHMVFYTGYLGPTGKQGLESIIDMIDYSVKLIGVDHVGLGSDFDGGSVPVDLVNAMHYYKITEELVKRGFSEEDIEKILGKNTLRVFGAIQDLAEAPVIGGEPVVIIAGIGMGDILDNPTPLIKAKAQGNQIDFSRFRIIVDGIAYNPEYSAESGQIHLSIKEPLRDNFHVVTFEGANTSGQVTRVTKIFYIASQLQGRNESYHARAPNGTNLSAKGNGRVTYKGIRHNILL